MTPAPHARWLLLAAAALLGLATLFLFWRRAAEVPAAAAADLIVVAPVALPGAGADAAWIRLGVMDYIAARLRGAGLVVLPSERVAGLVAERGDESPQELHSRLRRASGAGLLLQPEARQRSDGTWQLLLQPVAEHAGTPASGRGASPLAAADAAVAELLAQLGRAPATAAPASPDAAAERLQRLDAAMLEGDLAGARALIAAADPAARAEPALRVREGQLAFRAGNLEATETIFGALQANLGQLPPELQAQALAGLGALAVRRGQYAEAERRYAESLAVLGPDGRQDLIGNGFTGRGVARAAQGQHELAAADLARARVALERAGDAPGVASVDTNLGLLQSRSGKPALALQSFERAIAVFDRYDVRDSLAASLLGLARTLQLLADNAAALASARHAAELGRQLENPVLLRNIAQQLADTLIANGRLTEAAGIVDSLPTAPTPAEGLAELRLRLALEQGRHAEALRLGAAAPATDATAQLLFVQAALAAGPATDAATRSRVGANLAALTGDDAAAHLARALWQDAAGDATGAAGHFAAALAKADAEGDVSRRIEILAAWIATLLRQGETDRATVLAGQIAPLIERDYRAARAAALYYRAVGDAHLQAAAERSLQGLAGERAAGLP